MSFQKLTLRPVMRGVYWLALICSSFSLPFAHAQVDQGAITGVVQDKSGAVVPAAQVTLTAIDNGLVLQEKANEKGIYVFSPLKIGNYKVSAVSPGFRTTTRENLHLDAQARLNILLTLEPGEISQTVTVTDEAPLLETQTGAAGQTIDTKTINDTPLNGRNWVYIAQLTAGVAPPLGNTRGSGTGDFISNGQRAEQNNFVLDGVDNNTNLVDFLNGSSFVVRPPPDALSEFNIQTSNYSAEFGHSAGAVLSASIKSGTNAIHGDLWEYVRNTELDATNWNALTNPPYHQNQFGATLGFPIIKNKLFYFGDVEANRISIGQTNVLSVPTPLMRQGNFSELLNTGLTGSAQPTQLYQPNSADPNQKLNCNGQNNVFCPNQINAVAQRILNLYPQPNANGGKTFNNLVENVSQHNNTWQWDQRLDWNITSKDQAYARYSYLHQITSNDLPLGPILDGSGYGGGQNTSLAENFMLSETHIFTPTLTNEFRFGYNWGVFKFLQANANDTSLPASLGLGGVPDLGPGQGGLPSGNVSGISTWGSPSTNFESQNVYQILDNVTKIVGNHALKFGVSFQSVRFAYQYAPDARGSYYYYGTYTGVPGVSFTGSAVADFLADQMFGANVSNAPNINDAQWYDAGYAQDDWKVTPHLTLNFGLRYDYFQPYKNTAGEQGNFVVNGPLGIKTGSGIYQLPGGLSGMALSPLFLSTLAKDNVSVQYVDNERLVSTQTLNFGPRVGFAWQTDPKTVFRGGFGIFYGGLQSQGGENLGSNFPFFNQANFAAPDCELHNCPSASAQGISLETGTQPVIANGGLANYVNLPGFRASDTNVKTPYTMSYSFGMQESLSSNMVATLSYIGNVARHLSLNFAPNTAPGLFNPSVNTTFQNPFPDLGVIGQINYTGVSTYNSLQAKLEKRFSHGLSFLGTYTWAHALDDSNSAGALSTGITNRNQLLLPFITEYTNSAYDVRNRFTFNGNYELPFGRGRAFASHTPRVVDEVVGGWSSSLTFAAQSGVPLTVDSNISTASGGTARATLVRDPFTPGGTPDPSNPNVTCAPATRTKANWYNPCAFANPVAGNRVAPPGQAVGAIDPTSGLPYLYPSGVSDQAAAIALLGGRSNTLYGPGYYSVNMSVFKNFITWHEQYLQFRADGFNVLNHPTLGNPSTHNVNSNGGNITGPKTFQNDTPDARFFQLALKYTF